MNQSVGRSLERSKEDFVRIVWPRIGRQFGRIIPVESVSATEFAKELDMRSGVDVWVIQDSLGGHMRGLASRVQWPNGDAFGTFTIRVRSSHGYETEYHKRRKELAIEGSVRPHYICHAYVRCINPDPPGRGHGNCGTEHHTELLGAAIGRMRDVIDAVERDAGRLMRRNDDGSQGYAVPWSCLKDIAIWPDPTGAQVGGA